MATMVTADIPLHPDQYDKQELAKIWVFVGSLGLSKGDLAKELRNRIDTVTLGNTEKSEKAEGSKAKPSKRSKGGEDQGDAKRKKAKKEDAGEAPKKRKQR